MYQILTNPWVVFSEPVFWIFLPFQLWMFIDAVRRREWIWAIFIFFFSVLSALFYWLMVYRQEGPASGGGGGGGAGWEWPGSKTRRRIKELKGRIYNLDHARDHLDLADIYLEQGKLTLAEESYRAALQRDAEDLEAQAHLGLCLLRQQRPAEARPLLESVLRSDPKHDYGQTRTALAEALTAVGETDAAIREWEQVLVSHSYARAKVQYAELLQKRGDVARARQELQEVVNDDAHAPRFDRQREKVWVRRAQRLLSKLEGHVPRS